MTEEKVLELLRRGEGSACAFLPARTRSQKLGETLVALANTHGGLVLLGVRGRRRGSVEGLPAPEESRRFVLGVARDCAPPISLPQPEVVAVRGKSLLVITVPAGLPYVYHWRGRYLHRPGAKNVALSGAELRGILLERSEEKFDALVPAGAVLDDLDMAQVNAYVAGLEDAPAELLQHLQQRGCVSDTPDGLRPTHAGLLLFGKDPQAFLPQAHVVLVRYPGTTPSRNPLRQEARGSLLDQVRQAEAFLESHMRRGRIQVESERVEITEYPLEAVREALVNAVAHRDYSLRGDAIRVSMFQDRIEVYSPGRLPGPVTVEKIAEERFSRNPAIVQVLADMGMIGRLGHGIGNLVALMEEAGLPKPAFREVRAGFQLTLHGPRGMPMEDLPADPQVLARLGLNERQVEVLIYLNENERITSREYQGLCPDVSAETLRRDLAGLVARGILLKVGERRATYYILK